LKKWGQDGDCKARGYLKERQVSMARKWNKTKYPGVRCREHETRKHGIKKDQYFAIRYQRDGRRKEEGLGWATEGWTVEKAAVELAELKKNYLLGTGKPSSLKEKRIFGKERKRQEDEGKACLERESLTFGAYFEKTYYPLSQTSRKTQSYKK
jgi:hypothetical protein